MNYKPDYRYIPPITWPILTPLYDFFCVIGGLGTRFKKKVLRAISLREGMHVLDIGCGTGVLLKAKKEMYPKVSFIGCDPNKKALAIAERRLAKAKLSVELTEAFAESLPFPNGSLGVCFSTLAVFPMPNEIKRRAIAECYRILSPGGRIVIADLGETKSILLRKALFFEKIEYLEGNFTGVIPRFLTEAGFKGIRIVGRHFPCIDIIVAEK